MKRRGWSEGELARRAGTTQPTVHRIIKGESKSPRQENIQAIAKAFGCSAEWLWSGTGRTPAGAEDSQPSKTSADIVRDMLAKHGKGLSDGAREKIASAVEEAQGTYEQSANVITADFSRPGLVGDEIVIPHYDVRAAMGDGQLPADYVEVLRNVTVSQKHIKDLGVSYDSATHLGLITGWGQSMEPTINDKDPLIIDLSIREFDDDGIFVLTWQNHVYIKRLQIADAEHFDMISDNPQHKDRLVRIEDVTIHARVKLVWNAKKV